VLSTCSKSTDPPRENADVRRKRHCLLSLPAPSQRIRQEKMQMSAGNGIVCCLSCESRNPVRPWTPAFAGVTILKASDKNPGNLAPCVPRGDGGGRRTGTQQARLRTRKRRLLALFLRKQESSTLAGAYRVRCLPGTRPLDPCVRRGDGIRGHKQSVSRGSFVRGALSAITLNSGAPARAGGAPVNSRVPVDPSRQWWEKQRSIENTMAAFTSLQAWIAS